MTMHGARQMRGQRLTTRAQALLLCHRRRGDERRSGGGERVDLGLKGGDIGADGLIKPVPMHSS